MAKQNPITWHELQGALMEATSEKEVEALIKKEKAGPNRGRWLLRMQGRLNVLRREREINDIIGSSV